MAKQIILLIIKLSNVETGEEEYIKEESRRYSQDGVVKVAGGVVPGVGERRFGMSFNSTDDVDFSRDLVVISSYAYPPTPAILLRLSTCNFCTVEESRMKSENQ